MKTKMKEIVKKVLYGPLAPIASLLFQCISNMEYWYFEQKWKKQGFSLPDPEEAAFVQENVTVIFKSFERQKPAEVLSGRSGCDCRRQQTAVGPARGVPDDHSAAL